jgi:hypothetical protein
VDSAPLCAWVGSCVENRGDHAFGVTGPFCGEHAGGDGAVPNFALTPVIVAERTCWAVPHDVRIWPILAVKVDGRRVRVSGVNPPRSANSPAAIGAHEPWRPLSKQVPTWR